MSAKKSTSMDKPRSRVFRDPIHGDIFAGPLQSSIVDTTVFQRLRFIRQNGLLHLVFPGAVHTRFAHSLGTMHLAQRVFAVLFPEYSPRQSNFAKSKALSYIGTVFETTALLHDIGHCAFSHSIERIKLGSELFFPPLATLVEEWSKKEAPGLCEWWKLRTGSGEYSPPKETQHEDLGLLMVGVLFGGCYPHVSETCKSLLKVDPEVFADDVRAMLVSGHKLKPSDRFLGYAEDVTKSIQGASKMDGRKRAEDLLVALHTLVSGTLDVDRLDYLVRDSRYTGTPYGVCDVEVLVNGLCLAVSKEPDDVTLVHALRSRATRALDDLLWSRYQLFSQVLNHKTNVILNALLADAIPEAIEEVSIPIKRPKAFIDFLEFTDDHVLSSVIRACLRSEHRDKAYDRALVHRALPLYLGKLDLSGEEGHDKKPVEDEKCRFAREILGSESRASDIRTWSVDSALIKGGGMPHVLVYDKVARRDVLRAPGAPGNYQILEWTRDMKLPAQVKSYHFFVDRNCIPK